MTDKKHDDKNPMDELEQEMEELSGQEEELEKLKKENKVLNIELEKFRQIAANTQSQYVSLKYDFDIYMSRIEKEKKSMKRDSLIKSVKEILPFVEELRKTIDNLEPENPAFTGVSMVYQNMINKLKDMGFEMFECVGQEPNHDYHEPIGFQESSEEMKGKIVTEFSKCFIYRDENEEIVVNPAKVLIGQ